MSSDKEHYHDKGQKDGSENKYERPHGVLDELTTWSDEGMKKNSEENEAYDKGWEHGREQSKYRKD